jgi:hypothetical protein
MKRREITRLQQLLQLADHLKQLGENHPAEIILTHIAHTISETFERTDNGKASSSHPAV